MERVLGRALSVDEAVAIALETQPAIQARLADYQAAASAWIRSSRRCCRSSTDSSAAARSQTAQSTRRLDRSIRGRATATLTTIRPFGETLTARR